MFLDRWILLGVQVNALITLSIYALSCVNSCSGSEGNLLWIQPIWKTWNWCYTSCKDMLCWGEQKVWSESCVELLLVLMWLSSLQDWRRRLADKDGELERLTEQLHKSDTQLRQREDALQVECLLCVVLLVSWMNVTLVRYIKRHYRTIGVYR